VNAPSESGSVVPLTFSTAYRQSCGRIYIGASPRLSFPARAERLRPFHEIGEIAVEEFLGYVRRNGVHAPHRASTHEVTPTHSRCVHPFEPRIDRAEKRIEPSGDVVANPTGLQHALLENNEERWQQIEQPEPAQPFPEPIEFRTVHACIQRWRRALSADRLPQLNSRASASSGLVQPGLLTGFAAKQPSGLVRVVMTIVGIIRM
jgi:hypothetical protein